ncbi:hypothetical protein ACOYR4_06140 [Acidovorax sp. M14]|uniref:hypothetical protein n=1 Tax=Acidovorax sp. M14 TaxID=3411354 RepID=UPI003BF53752
MSQSPYQFTEVPQSIIQKIEALQQESLRDIDALTDGIAVKQKEFATVGGSICFEDAAALVVDTLRRLLKSRREKIYAAAGRALHLVSHVETESGASYNGDGELQFKKRNVAHLDIIGHDGDALDVLALIWGDEEIKAFAAEALSKVGAKPAPEGLTVAEALSRSNALVSEMKTLSQTRSAAVAAMKQIGAVTLQQFVHPRKQAPAANSVGRES